MIFYGSQTFKLASTGWLVRPQIFYLGWLLLCGLVALSKGASAASGFATQEITPQQTTEPLVNPGMGLYLAGTLKAEDMPTDAWFSKLLNIGYFRDDWSQLEPAAAGDYKFDAYFKPIFELWVKQRGKRVAFRFMSENMHSRQKYVTPKWVFDSGVPSVTHKGIYVPEQIDPVFWDDRYLAIQEKFIADLGRYLDGKPGLEFIDIGSIGEWGEMHLARWTSEQLAQTGYTRAKYIGAYRRLIDAFARAFPHTRVFLNVGDYDTINDYAAIHHINFRQDGLNPAGPSANVGKRFYLPYSRRGVICNYELYGGYSEMKQKGWGVQATFDKGLEDPISYLHVNLMGWHELLKPPAEVKTAVEDAARRIGFRFVLARLQCNQTLRLNGNHPSRLFLAATWKNLGVAPCYDSYAVRWSLVNAGGEVVAEQLDYPQTPTTLWWPGETTTEQSVLTIPAGLAPSTYHIAVAMVKPEAPTLQVQLAIAGRDATGRYDLGTITAVKTVAETGPVYEQGFETAAHGWQATRRMTLRLDPTAHSGKSSLLVEGTQVGEAWNYAAVRLPQPILPSSRYRLSCWMKVDHIEPTGKAPYLKIGLTDGAGKWLTNVSTSHYDEAKLGTWQYLVGDVETTGATVHGDLAIEKGDLETKVTTTLRLDDVKLELLESP